MFPVPDSYWKARFDAPKDAGFALHKLAEEMGEMTGAWLQLYGQGRGTANREDLADELADVLGFLLVFADREGIDPAEALIRKWGRHLPDRGTCAEEDKAPGTLSG